MLPLSVLLSASLVVLGGLSSTVDGQEPSAGSTTVELTFASHDGYPMRGKLTLPEGDDKHPVVIYVQAAEGMTIDMKRPLGGGRTFRYFDLYVEQLPIRGIGFFRYEGRGIGMGDEPPRYEAIEREVYDTSTLENKVRDLLAAVELVCAQEGVDPARVFVMGASEGTLLAAEAATRAEGRIAGLALYGAMSGTLRELFRFIMTDGAFLAYREYFDTDGDDRITKDELEADPKGYRKNVFRNAPFSAFDGNEDGVFTAADMPLLTAVYLTATDTDDFDVLDHWARTAAGVSTPAGWFADHFAHEPIWTYLSQLEIPIGFFHGEDDAASPVAGIRGLEEQARAAGKDRMQFHYFPGLDHTLDIGDYFSSAELPDGHIALFDFLEALAHGH